MSSVGVLFVLSSLNAVTWPNERERYKDRVEMRVREAERDGTWCVRAKEAEIRKAKVTEDIRGEGELRMFPCHCRKWLEMPSRLQIFSCCTETEKRSETKRGQMVRSVDEVGGSSQAKSIDMSVNLWHSRRENPGFLLWVQSHVWLIGHGCESVSLYLPQRGRGYDEEGTSHNDLKDYTAKKKDLSW